MASAPTTVRGSIRGDGSGRGSGERGAHRSTADHRDLLAGQPPTDGFRPWPDRADVDQGPRAETSGQLSAAVWAAQAFAVALNRARYAGDAQAEPEVDPGPA